MDWLGPAHLGWARPDLLHVPLPLLSFSFPSPSSSSFTSFRPPLPSGTTGLNRAFASPAMTDAEKATEYTVLLKTWSGTSTLSLCSHPFGPSKPSVQTQNWCLWWKNYKSHGRNPCTKMSDSAALSWPRFSLVSSIRFALRYLRHSKHICISLFT